MIDVIERTEYSAHFEHFDIDSDRRAYWTTRKEWRNADWRNAYVYVNGAYWDLTEDLKATICKNHEVTTEDLRSMVNDAMSRRAYSSDISDYSFEEVSQIRALAVLEDDADMLESWRRVAQTKLTSELENVTTAEPAATDQATATAEAKDAQEAAREAMEEAGEHERKAAEAAWSYDTETAAAHAQQAEEAAQRAEQAARNASYAADDAGTLEAHEWADMAAEYAAYARRDADRATETAEANARELEERAEIIAAIEPEDLREYIQTEADRHHWSPEETRESIAFYLASRAARALLDAYAETIGETIDADDPEAVAAYRVAHDEMKNRSHHATTNDREQVAYMVEVIARAFARPDLTKYEAMPFLDIYQRDELEAYIGAERLGDYDLEAIEHEATAYDPATSRTVWTAGPEELTNICQRHELATA